MNDSPMYCVLLFADILTQLRNDLGAPCVLLWFLREETINAVEEIPKQELEKVASKPGKSTRLKAYPFTDV